MAISDLVRAADVQEALDAKLHPGHDPNSEYGNNAILYSSVQYGAKKDQPEGFWEEMTDLIGDVRDYLSNNSPKSYDLFQNESPGLGTLQMEGHSGVGKGAGENMPANDFGSPFVLPQGDGFTGRHSGGPGGDSGDVSGLSGAPISITGGGPATPPMPPSSGLLP